MKSVGEVCSTPGYTLGCAGDLVCSQTNNTCVCPAGWNYVQDNLCVYPTATTTQAPTAVPTTQPPTAVPTTQPPTSILTSTAAPTTSEYETCWLQK